MSDDYENDFENNGGGQPAAAEPVGVIDGPPEAIAPNLSEPTLSPNHDTVAPVSGAEDTKDEYEAFEEPAPVESAEPSLPTAAETSPLPPPQAIVSAVPVAAEEDYPLDTEAPPPPIARLATVLPPEPRAPSPAEHRSASPSAPQPAQTSAHEHFPSFTRTSSVASDSFDATALSVGNLAESSASSELNLTRAELANSKRRNAHLEKKLKSIEAEKAEMQARCDKLESSNKTLRLELKGFMRQLDEVIKAKQSEPKKKEPVPKPKPSEEDTSQLQHQIEVRDRNIVNLNKKNDLLRKEIANLSKQLEALSAEHTTDIENQLTVKSKRVDELEEEIRTLKKLQRHKDQALLASGETTDAKIASLNSENKDLRELVAKHVKSAAESEKKLRDYHTKIIAVTERYQKLLTATGQKDPTLASIGMRLSVTSNAAGFSATNSPSNASGIAFGRKNSTLSCAGAMMMGSGAERSMSPLDYTPNPASPTALRSKSSLASPKLADLSNEVSLNASGDTSAVDKKAELTSLLLDSAADKAKGQAATAKSSHRSDSIGSPHETYEDDFTIA